MNHRNTTRNNFSFINLTEVYVEENPNYIELFEFEKQDYRQIHEWIERNLFFLFALAPAYLGGILGLQRWMKDRKPFELRKVLFVWNVFLAVLSFIMFYRSVPEIFYILNKYGFYRTYCKRDHVNAATLFWGTVYSASKILEFVDTVFICLRKQKLTFLHTFHHSSIYVASVFSMIRGDPAARYFILTNTFIHTIMYTYFAVKALRIQISKKFAMLITTLQLIQFITAIIINALVFYAKAMGSQPSCDRPDDLSLYFLTLASIYFLLFSNFFVQTYLRTKPSAEAEKSKLS